MKSKNALCGLSIAVALHLGVLAGSAQTFSDSQSPANVQRFYRAQLSL